MSATQLNTTNRKASTIVEFCEEHRISRRFFYKLKQQGRAPRVTVLGTKQIITNEDAAAWRLAMSARSAA